MSIMACLAGKLHQSWRNLLSSNGDELVIYKIHTQKERELAGVFDIQSLPSLLFIPVEGQPQLAKGALSKETFIEAIETVLKMTKLLNTYF